MRDHYLSVVFTVGIFPFAVGCDEAPEQGTLAAPEQTPAAVALADERTAAEQALCGWTHDLDAVVIGTITAVRLSAEPCLQPQGNPSILDAPPRGGEVAQALEIDLEVTGVLAGDAPRTLTVSLGPELLEEWERQPVNHLRGDEYRGASHPRWMGDDSVLAPGVVVALPLVKLADRPVWATVPSFFVGRDDALSLNTASSQLPDVAMTADELRGAFTTCAAAGEASDGRRGAWPRLMRSAPLRVRAQMDLAVCSQTVDDGAACRRDRDCEAGQTCNAGRCE